MTPNVASTIASTRPIRLSALISAIPALLVFLSIWATGFDSPVYAHGGATGIVKERMDLMKEMGDRTKAIGKMLKGKASLDPKFVREAATFIGAASTRFRDMFPPGSDQKPTETLPTVWSEWPRFVSSLDELSEMAAELEEAARNIDEKAILREFVNVAKVCKSCHKQFRK
jgi:cytochrome c556